MLAKYAEDIENENVFEPIAVDLSEMQRKRADNLVILMSADNGASCRRFCRSIAKQRHGQVYRNYEDARSNKWR